MSHPLRLLLLAALLVWHALAVGQAWTRVVQVDHGRDFATYYYAAKVVQQGGDPYLRGALARASQADGTRRSAYPFLYPPSFLLAVHPTAWVSLKTAYMGWFWLCEICLALSAAVLARWWGRRDPDLVLAVIAAAALSTGVANNLAMGQANLPVLALTLAGAWQVDRGRGGLGGTLVGLAVALKLSPALVVAWWLLRGRWRAVLAAALVAGMAVAASVGLYGTTPLTSFVFRVLPSLSDGSYNGLGLPVHLFGNHSLPNLWHQLLPSGGPTLSTGARLASTGTALALLAGLVWRFGPPREPHRDGHGGGDGLTRHAQLAGVLVLGLLLPVFTWEHHTIWALPAVVLAGGALARGRLHPGWAVPVGLAIGAWAVDLVWLRHLAEVAPWWLAATLQEAKCVALLVLLAAMGWLGGSRWRTGRGMQGERHG